MNKKIIVFDVDRTLVDSFMPELLSLKEAIKFAVGKNVSEDELKQLTMLPTKVFFNKIGLNIDEIKLVNKEWDRLLRNYPTKCFNGLKDVIKELNREGYIISIITSRTNEEFHELDDELKDITNLFKIVVTSDLVNNHKPNRDSMDYLCNKLNCNTNDVIYIGDSIIDKEFANNSNCLFIPACWENKELINEDNSVSDVRDILNIINKI